MHVGVLCKLSSGPCDGQGGGEDGWIPGLLMIVQIVSCPRMSSLGAEIQPIFCSLTRPYTLTQNCQDQEDAFL